METSLHRDLKLRYAASPEQTEITVGAYRIDAISGDELIEVQHASLGAIRDKIRELLATHRVRVVKPIIARRLLVKRSRCRGPVVDRRHSPKRGTLLDLFHDLVHFTSAFPHPRLTLEALLVEVEEWRRPRRDRRHRKPYFVEDQKLLAIRQTTSLRTAADLQALIACELPSPFHTGHLAEGLCIDRWTAQRIAYVLRKCGAASIVGKHRNAPLYELVADGRSANLRRAG